MSTKTDEEILNELKKDAIGYTPYDYDDGQGWVDSEYADDDEADEDVEKGYDTLDGEFTIEKADEKKGLVFGWASVIRKNGKVVVDRQNDVIEDDWEMEKAAYRYVLTSRVGGHEHVKKGVSVLVESMAFTDEKCEALGLPDSFPRGWWVGYQITDKEVMKNMVAGKYTGFSVHGTGKRTQLTKGSKPKGMSYGDINAALRTALTEMYPSIPGGSYRYCYVSDFGDDWVVYSVDGGGASAYYQASYTIEDGVASITDPFEVRSKITYVKKGEFTSERTADVLSRFKNVTKGLR